MADHPKTSHDTDIEVHGHQNVTITGDVGGNVTITIGGRDVRGEELAYLNGLIEKYHYWAEKYTPLAGIAEVRSAAAQGPRLDLPTLFMPTGFEKLEEHGFGEQRRTERVPVDDLRDAVTKYERLVLLGEPGSGKTTTLWRLAYDLAVAAKADPQAPLPLLAPLGGYTGPENALTHATTYFEEFGPYLPTYLRSKRVVLLLDGLNEMPQTGYRERVGRIQWLLDQYPNTPVVVTCRALDYVETLNLEKLEVKQLEPEQQREYLVRYLGKIDGEKLFQQMGGTMATERGRGAQNAQLSPLLDLGRNPFMLVMTAQVYAAGKGALPANRGRLFAAFVDTLLTREEKRCDPAIWPGADTLRRSMAQLAYAMQKEGERGTAVDAKWAAKHLAQRGVDAKRIACLCASATLLDTANSQMRFLHQLVQEYFAALALAGELQKGDNLGKYWPKDWTQPSGWEETFVLLAGILPDMTALIERLLPAHPALAARCIAESGGERPAEATVRTVQRRLVELMTDPRVPVPERNAAGVAINHVGDPRRGVGLRADGLPDIEWVLVPDKNPKSGRREFTFGDDRQGNPEQRTEPDFWIACYPITCAQFQAFLDAPDGFSNAPWWQGLAALPEHRGEAGGQQFKHWNHPRERVSWYDAVAFCRWLTERAKEHPDLLPRDPDRSREWKITLPTEWQWEKTERGHDGIQYPRDGDKYKSGYPTIDETLTTARAAYLKRTTAVGMYPQGVSPYGIADLSNNLLEWCLNEYDNPERVQLEGDAWRVLRGGSWFSFELEAYVPCRNADHPDYRGYGYGFRVCAVIRQE